MASSPASTASREKGACDSLCRHMWRPCLIVTLALPNVVLLTCFSNLVPESVFLEVKGDSPEESVGLCLVRWLAEQHFSKMFPLFLCFLALLSGIVLYIVGWPTWSETDEDENQEGEASQSLTQRDKVTRLSPIQVLTGQIPIFFATLGCILNAIRWPIFSRLAVLSYMFPLSWLASKWRRCYRVHPDDKEYIRWAIAVLYLTSGCLIAVSVYRLHDHPKWWLWADFREDIRHNTTSYEGVFKSMAQSVRANLTLKVEHCKDHAAMKSFVEHSDLGLEGLIKVEKVCQQEDLVFLMMYLTQFWGVMLFFVVFFAHVVEHLWLTGEKRIPDPSRTATQILVLTSVGFIAVWISFTVSGANVSLANGIVSVGFAVLACGMMWAAWNVSRIYRAVFDQPAEQSGTGKTMSENSLCKDNSRHKALKDLMDNEWIQAIMVGSGLIPLLYTLETLRRKWYRYHHGGERVQEDCERTHEPMNFNRITNMFMDMVEGERRCHKAHEKRMVKAETGRVEGEGSAQVGTCSQNPGTPNSNPPPSSNSSQRATSRPPTPLPEPHKGWNWCSIFVKVCLLGELYFVLQVGGTKATYVFLSYMQDVLAPQDFSVILGLVFVVGLIMFLLPPVPGVPVYVFCGIVVCKAWVVRSDGEDEQTEFVKGLVIAVGLGLLLKLLACAGQYSIGYFLGQSIRVQKFIGVDTKPTRAIAKVVSEKNPEDCLGRLGKMMVLVGGPDWPTSVTCGILKVDIISMLVNTIPVIFIMAPCVAAGAYIAKVKPGETSSDSTLANVFSLLAAGGQGLSMLGAMFVLRKVYNEDKHLEDPPEDPEALWIYKEVVKLRKQEQDYNERYDEVLRGTEIADTKSLCSLGHGRVIVLAAILTVASNAAFTTDFTFENFTVSSKISDSLTSYGLGGNGWNIVKLPGWIALLFFSVSVVLHIAFVEVKKCEAKLRESASSETEPLVEPVATEGL